jgi:Acetyltransferase (GNAT) domain
MIATPAPARPGTIERLKVSARYAWDNSGDRRVLTARRLWEAIAERRVRAVVSRCEGASPTIAYAGWEPGFVTILPLLEHQRAHQAGTASSRTERWISWSELPRNGVTGSADIVTVGGDAGDLSRLPGTRSLILPFRVHLVVDVDGDAESMRRRICPRERWEFRRNRRRHDWTWEWDDDPRAFEHFYERMHRPTMARRHGPRTRTEQKAAAYECLFCRGPLFFVSEAGRRVAGVLCRWDPRTRTLTTRLLGVLDGDQAHYRSGAFKAVYHLLIEWACGAGVEHIDLHGTEALISKGIFQWKRKFHPRVVLAPNHFAHKRVWLHVARDSEAVRRFLVANPVLAMTAQGDMEALYFRDRDRQPRTDLGSSCPGVLRRREVDLDVFLSGTGAACHAIGTAPA